MNNRFILSISFAKYIKEKSGMAKVHMAHQQMYNSKGISYVHIFAVKKQFFYGKWTAFCMHGMYIDGEYKGIFTIEEIINMIASWKNQGCKLIDIHVHHMLYLKTKQLNKLFSSIKYVPIKCYLHDYYMVCSNYTLMRNRQKYCGTEGVSAEHCKNCEFYNKSRSRVKELRLLLGKIEDRVTFISPSDAAKRIFLSVYPHYEKKTIVIEHQCFNTYYAGNSEIIKEDEKIRIAYLGMPALHKGWEVWKNIVECSDRSKYEFYIFNSSDDEYKGMKKVRVGYSESNLNAMTEALRDNRIHAVLLWALWPETYSYTCFEAFAANAYIITNNISGNITDVVWEQKNGCVLEKESELKSLFECYSELKKEINSYRIGEHVVPDILYENTKIVTLSLENEECDNSISAVKIQLLGGLFAKMLNRLFLVGWIK